MFVYIQKLEVIAYSYTIKKWREKLHAYILKKVKTIYLSDNK